MTSISFEPVPLLMLGDDRQGQLAFVNGRLAAVFVRLDDEIHQPSDRGRWHLECSIGSCSWHPHPAPFQTLADAALWLMQTAVSAAANHEPGDNDCPGESERVPERIGATA